MNNNQKYIVTSPWCHLLADTIYFSNMIKYTVEQGEMSQAEAESFFNLKSYISQVLIATPIMGIVTSAIVALFTRKKW